MTTQKKIECDVCQDELWVCENHPEKPWNARLPNGCACGAGMPCLVCNDGLQRGHGFDAVLSVATDTSIDTSKTPKVN